MLLLIIRYDSQKHFELYNAVLELIRAEPKAISEEVNLKLKDIVEDHIKYEEEMLK